MAARAEAPADPGPGASGIMPRFNTFGVPPVRKLLDVFLVLLTLEFCFFLFKQAMRWFPN